MCFFNFRTWFVGVCVAALAGCGGGGGGGDSVLGSGSGTPVLGTAIVSPAASDLVLTLGAATVQNDGKATVTATAIALDARNNAVAGVPILISADTGVVTPAASKTDADGTLSAAIGIGSNTAPRVITVTATSGAKTKTARLQVVASGGLAGVDPSDLLVSLSQVSIPNDGSQTVTVTAFALDQQRNVLAGVPVTFAVDQGATVAPSGSVTTAGGTLTAVVGIGTDRSNRTINVTAQAKGLPARSVQLPVVSTVGTSKPAAADLSLVLSRSTLDNTTAASVVATATAVDANRNTLAGIPVTFTVDGNAVLTPASTLTDANGVVSATVRIGSDLTNRVINVSAVSGNLVRSKAVSVRGAALAASLSPVVTVSTVGNRISYKLVDVNAQPMPNQSIAVSAPGLQAASGVTNINGAFDYSFTAPSQAGELTVTAVAAGATRETKVTVVTAGSNGVPAATIKPEGVSLSAAPSVVPVNAVGSSANQAQLRALFVGPDNAPVPNLRVRFDLAGNANSTDGTVGYVGAFAYSDASGVARGTFTPGQVGSPTDGVTVRACWAQTDEAFANSPCPNAVTTKLTVSAEALSVAIGTDNTVGTGTQDLTYTKRFAVMVVDAAGQAKPGVTVTPLVDLPRFYKGFYAWNGDIWVQNNTLRRFDGSVERDSPEVYVWNATTKSWSLGAPSRSPSCPNEDVNRNAVREASVYTAGMMPPALAGRQEDLNWNGELDARKAYVAITMVGGATTDANGLAYVQIEYPKSVATWIDALITVTASGIGGSEAKATHAFSLPGAAADMSDEKVPPPFALSPLGTSGSCQDSM